MPPKVEEVRIEEVRLLDILHVEGKQVQVGKIERTRYGIIINGTYYYSYGFGYVLIERA